MPTSPIYRCAILTPSGDEFRRVAETLTSTLAEFGVRASWVTGIDANNLTMDPDGYSRLSMVQLELRRATHLIVDITGDNPSIMYELGIAHASRKPVLIIARDESGIEGGRQQFPAPLVGFLVFQYSAANPSPLVQWARHWATDQFANSELAVAHGG